MTKDRTSYRVKDVQITDTEGFIKAIRKIGKITINHM